VPELADLLNEDLRARLRFVAATHERRSLGVLA
jgi:hypothetical protein